jgi:hypothetical protein
MVTPCCRTAAGTTVARLRGMQPSRAQVFSAILGILGADSGTIAAGSDGGAGRVSCNGCTSSQSGQIVWTTRDSSPDVGSDDPELACALDATYRYGDVGGLVAHSDTVTLTPPASYVYNRTSYSPTLPPHLSCSPPLPACNTPAVIDVADLLRDLRHADVQRALAAAAPPLYGHDTRPADGTVFKFLRGDGRGFLVGEACWAGACVEIPAGIARLVADLRALDSQQLKRPSCAALR